MPNQPKDTDTEEIEWKHALAERLKELIIETRGDAKFKEKLEKNQLKGSTTATVLNGWRDTGKGISLKKIYLIAMTCNISVDWLLGLSVEKSRSKGIFKHPATYGDVMSILNNLIKMKVIKITSIVHLVSDEEDYTENGIVLPRYIRIINDHLIDLIKDLYRSQELSEQQVTDAWERTIKSEMNTPIQEHDGNSNHNSAGSEQATGKETAVSAEFLDDDALKNKVAERLDKLKNDLPGAEFGKKIGIPKSTVNDWFSGKKHLPKPYNIYKIAKEYHVHADWILGLEEDSHTKDDVYTYGSVLSILKYLIDKGTIDFFGEYFLHHYDREPEDSLVINDLLPIEDPFLSCFLLNQNMLKEYSEPVFKEMAEEMRNKYKDTPLLSLKKIKKCDLQRFDVRRGRNKTDLDKMYEELQKLSDTKADK